jgi:photosystem II stability/assembly factor-like uncharacterized protein
MSWTHAADLPLVLLDWQAPDRLWAVGPTGEVFISSDSGRTWDRRGTVAGEPAALTSHEDTLYLALVDASILRSADGGRSWTVVHR